MKIPKLPKFKKPSIASITSRLRGLQLFINIHYRTIQFIFIVVLALLAMFIAFNQFEKAAEDSRHRQRQLLQREEDARAREAEIARLLEADQAIVMDIKENQEKQTLILCRLILRSNQFDLTPEEEAEIERICQEEIQRQQASPTRGQEDFLDR